MNIRNTTVVVLLSAIVLLVSSPVWSANVADLTSDTRVCPIRYYKAVYDDGPNYLLGIQPIGENASLLAMNWNSQGFHTRQYEIALSVQISKGVQTALIADQFDIEGETTSKQSLMLDISKGKFGLGVIAPLQDGKVKFGPRLSVGNVTGYMTVVEGSRPARGVSYFNKGLELDLAYMGETWYFRASKSVGKFIPELRTRFTDEETYIGFGLAFCPD